MKSKKKNTEEDLFVSEVISFYTKNGRHDLPWRKTENPYSILVSEIMLQQTQVKRVLEKYSLWMEKYPSLQSLSKASLQEVLVLWQGLGYQRRAKALFLISKSLKEIPRTTKELQDLPGVGIYTASAVYTFSYNVFGSPLLETNIRTALFYFFCKDMTLVEDSFLYNILFRLENNSLVKRLGARHWYYALMDYGAFLKKEKSSLNYKSKLYKKQSSFAGSLRQLRAKVLFSIVHNKELPEDERVDLVIKDLIAEGFISETKKGYLMK